MVSIPYAEASNIIKRIFSLSFPLSGLERTALSTSDSTDSYFDQQTSVEPAEPGQLIVTSADCKGIVIRKPVAEQANSTQENKPANIGQSSPKGH